MLEHSGDLDDNVIETIVAQHHVDIALTGDDVVQLRCSDSGAGMNKEIIRNNLLISGLSIRRDIIELQRRCAERHFQLERTGQFGIGVLSYFLIANELQIETRRLSEGADDDGTGWRFVTAGPGSFGELTKHPRTTSGTTVIMTLRDEYSRNISQFWSDTVEYVRETLVRIPCRFRMSSTVGHCATSVSIAPDWTRDVNALTRVACRGIEADLARTRKDLAEEVVSLAKKHERNQDFQAREKIARTAIEVLRWKVGKEVRVAGFGRVRIHVPYFELEIGNSLLFMDINVENDEIVIRPLPHRELDRSDVAHCTGVDGHVLLSWKGMSVTRHKTTFVGHSRVYMSSLGPGHPAVSEVDFDLPEVGRLSLNREFIELRDSLADEYSVVKGISNERRAAIMDLASSFPESPFVSVIYATLHQRLPTSDNVFWIRRERANDQPERYLWEKVRFPATRAHHVISEGLHSRSKLVLNQANAAEVKRGSVRAQRWRRPWRDSRVPWFSFLSRAA